MSALPKQTTDELYLELTEAGIDVDGTIEICEKIEALHIEYSGTDTSSFTEITVSHRAEFLQEEQVLRSKMRGLVTILIAAFSGAVIVASLLFFGVITDEPWLFVARAAVVLLLTLTVFSLLVLLQSMWSALLLERTMRAEAEEKCLEVEEKFSVATGVLKALY